MKRHSIHTATAPSTHSPSRILAPIRQPRMNERTLKGGIVTLLALRRLAPAVVQMIMSVQIIMHVQAISSAKSRSVDLFFQAGMVVLTIGWTMTMSAVLSLRTKASVWEQRALWGLARAGAILPVVNTTSRQKSGSYIEVTEMTLDSNSLLTTEELSTPRTPIELAQWIEDKGSMFQGNRYASLYKGLFKKYFEEVFPLNLFVQRLYAGRTDIQCTLNLDNRDFDATIVDYSTSPPAELKVEITYAVAEREYLRMEYFLEHGYVNAAGKVSSSGTKNTGHKIHVKDEFYGPTDLLEQACSRIQSAVARKSIQPNAPQKYGRGHVLLVAFNEWYVVHSVQDMAVIKDFVEKHVLTLPLNFAALYVAGLHGETFIRFAL